MVPTSHIPIPEERQAVVFRALRELVQSDAFRRSARIIRFLEYVVLESLSAAPRLSEKTIGIVVFDRAEDWAPKLDPIVRIEARRLREKLAQYYSSVSTEQAVVMDLPKGGYRVSFDWRAIPPTADSTVPHQDFEDATFEQPSNTDNKDLVTDEVRVSPPWSRRSFWLSMFSLTICIGFVLIALSVSDYRVAEERGIQIDALRVDSRLSQEFDGTEISGKIADQIRLLQQNTRATWTPPKVEDNWTSQHSSRWSSRVIDSLRALTRPQDELASSTTEVSGAIENSGADEISLYIGGGNIEPKSFVGSKGELPKLLLSAAEYIYGACQPSSYSVYLTEHGRSSDAISFTSSRYPKAKHLGDRVQILYSWATALSQQGDHKGAIEKYELNIGLAPQSWGSYVALQDEYEALGETERALETGHQLESRAHRGSWWFQHLPPRLFRNPGPDAYMAIDELTNDYIALKTAIEVEMRSREGGTALLPLYSPYGQVLSHLHERSNARLQLDLAANQQDSGAAEEDLIFAKVSLAVEEQDNEQLRSLLALYRKQITEELRRRSLTLEADNACEIMTAYERIDDTEMSDLLSSLAADSAECLSSKAQVQILRGHIIQAYALFERAIVDAPSLPSPHYEYGLSLLEHGDFRRARMELQLAHTTGPHWAEPLEGLAKLAIKQGDLKTSLNLYRQATLYAPSWGHLYVSWADALVRDGNNDGAAAKLRLAHTMDLSPAEEADFKRVAGSIHVTNQ